MDQTGEYLQQQPERKNPPPRLCEYPIKWSKCDAFNCIKFISE